MATQRIQRRIESLLDEADEAFAQGDWEVVRDRTQKVLALDPENTDATFFSQATERAEGAALQPIRDSVSTIPTQNLATQPTSFANGRHEVKRFLGEGGKELVYLAQDTLLDREVAFALINTFGFDQGEGIGAANLPHRRKPAGFKTLQQLLHTGP